MEISQFTYFQQCGGIDVDLVSGELTYGLERIAMYLQNCDNVYELEWCKGVSYGDVRHQEEVELSTYAFEILDVKASIRQFEMHEAACEEAIKCEPSLVMPAYDHCMKCSHLFNLIDARGAISVTERQRYIARVRHLASLCAHAYLAQRRRLGFPLLKGEARAQFQFDHTPSEVRRLATKNIP
jgi:glycyl-tRNA synthetase alpha chain